jgi:hypothetical protein
MKGKKLQLKKNIISKLNTFFIMGGIETGVPLTPQTNCTRYYEYSCHTSDPPISNPKGEKTGLVAPINTNTNTTTT